MGIDACEKKDCFILTLGRITNGSFGLFRNFLSFRIEAGNDKELGGNRYDNARLSFENAPRFEVGIRGYTRALSKCEYSL